MKKTFSKLAAVFVVAFVCKIGIAADPDLSTFIEHALTNAVKLKAVGIKPLAFWDFDGTIINGDVATGGNSPYWDHPVNYPGLVEESIHAGFSSRYHGKDGVVQFFEEYANMKKLGREIAYPYCGQFLAGVEVAKFDAFAERKFRDNLSNFYYSRSVEMLKALEAGGVENHIISASPEIFVRAAHETLGLPRERFHGVSLAERDGKLTLEIAYPIPAGDGKTELLKRLAGEYNGQPVVAFGNSYVTDGPFMLYTVTNSLPGGAIGSALMINGFDNKSGYIGKFENVQLLDICGGDFRCTLTEAQRAFYKIPRAQLEVLFDDQPFRHILRGGGTDRPIHPEINFSELVTNDVKNVELNVTVERDGGVESFFSGIVEGGTWRIFNPELGRKYHWTAKSRLGERSGTILTDTMTPRILEINGIGNVRDLGGWIGLDGRRVRQGMVYRSQGLNENSVNGERGCCRLNTEGLYYVTNTLGWKTDLDLRTDKECLGMDGSPAGTNVTWVHIRSSNYAGLFGKNGRDSLCKCLKVFLDPENYPIDFHCAAGQDRTGSLAFVLLGLLGVSEDDACRDWMTTGFWNGGAGFGYSRLYGPMKAELMKIKGADFRQKMENFVIECGFTKTDIMKLREQLLEECR